MNHRIIGFLGAIVLWTFSGFKTSISDYFEEGRIRKSYAVGIIVFIAIVMWISYTVKK